MKSSILIAFALTLSHFASADVISLDMSSLPSAQGWTYSASGPSHGGQIESAIWSTDGTTLSMNTMGSGLVSPSSNLYLQTGVVNAVDPIVLSWNSRVLQSQFVASSHYGWSVHFNTGGQGVIVGFETNLVRLGGATDVAFDTTGFHDYRIEFTPGAATFDLFVDNSLLSSGTASAGGTSQLAFGDGSGASNASAQMKTYSFSQVPEPGTGALLLCGALMALARRQRKCCNA